MIDATVDRPRSVIGLSPPGTAAPILARFGRLGAKIGREVDRIRRNLRQALALRFATKTRPATPGRDCVVVIVHESSRTGAPILGWNILRRLGERYDVLTLSLGGGDLLHDFKAASVGFAGPIARWRRHPRRIAAQLRRLVAGRRVRYAIVNSAECRPAIAECRSLGIPTVFLVHEFAAYTHDAASLGAAYDLADEVVFSAQMTADSSIAMHPALAHTGYHVLPQGMSTLPAGETSLRPPPDGLLAELRRLRAGGAHIVLGAGSIHLRKGVDLFIATAARLKRTRPDLDVRFLWIGGGYRPTTDLAYSVYLAEQIRRSQVADRLQMVDEVSDLDPFYDLVDVFFLSSRLDPLPNVAIDSLCRGIPVVAFDGASGICEILERDPETADLIAPHLDVDAAAARIAALSDDADRGERMRRSVRALATATFDMAAYVDRLDELGSRHAAGAAPRPT